jgi:hypothetical protein
VAKNNRAYKSAKRNKEISRQKKQEAKRVKRLEREKEEAEAALLTGGGETPIEPTPESE